jgi:hypothetical protein
MQVTARPQAVQALADAARQVTAAYLAAVALRADYDA